MIHEPRSHILHYLTESGVFVDVSKTSDTGWKVSARLSFMFLCRRKIEER